jgi:Proteobacterial transcriptional regulator-like domain
MPVRGRSSTVLRQGMAELPFRPPDWKSRDNYPDPQNTSSSQWAWEFLRRNPEYQLLWEKLIKPIYKSPRSANRLRPPILEFERQFHITDTFVQLPPSPAAKQAPTLYFDAPFILCRGASNAGPIRFDWSIGLNEMIVLFDMTRPIKPQLERVKMALVTASKDQENRNSEFHRHTRSYRKYLRLLDAEIAGATWSQIAKELYPHLSDAYPNRPGRRQGRSDFKIAKRLRDEDFWRIARSGQ